jgi:RNA polymerase primary sigma factor
VREDFLKNYLGSELDPLWLETVSKLTAKGWKNFVAATKTASRNYARKFAHL